MHRNFHFQTRTPHRWRFLVGLSGLITFITKSHRIRNLSRPNREQSCTTALSNNWKVRAADHIQAPFLSPFPVHKALRSKAFSWTFRPKDHFCLLFLGADWPAAHLYNLHRTSGDIRHICCVAVPFEVRGSSLSYIYAFSFLFFSFLPILCLSLAYF